MLSAARSRACGSRVRGGAALWLLACATGAGCSSFVAPTGTAPSVSAQDAIADVPTIAEHVSLGPDDVSVEASLLELTPLGTPEATVVALLEREHFDASVWRGHFPPHPRGDYPESATGGEAFIHTAIGRYRRLSDLFFETTVETFYSFDGEGRLIDIRVRHSVDAP